ncbi:MAG: hypothetical protein KBA31_12330 [Alphaproteobacteria bacterium]|nr:hypothetical protein [Alphaproteobacteria bacterium]
MIRFASFLAVALLVLVSFELYNGVARVKASQRQLEETKVQIAQEQEAIRVLKAEWSYLNQPERLQTLARQHLSLMPTAAAQIVVLASLPARGSTAPQPTVIEAGDLPSKIVPNAPRPRFKPEIPKAAP